MKLSFNLRNFLNREGQTLINSYKRLIATRKGISLDPAPHNAPATIKRKGFDKWMVHTDKLRRNGFKMLAWPMRLKVYASTDVHSVRVSKRTGKTWTVTHEQLFLYHNQGHPEKRYSGVFSKFPAGSRFPDRLSAEVYKQMKPQLEKEFKRRIKRVI